MIQDKDIAETIWKKLKGKEIPKSYSDKDISEIVTQYWHKAMESEQ